jgi:hypothetical protein
LPFRPTPGNSKDFRRTGQLLGTNFVEGNDAYPPSLSGTVLAKTARTENFLLSIFNFQLGRGENVESRLSRVEWGRISQARPRLKNKKLFTLRHFRPSCSFVEQPDEARYRSPRFWKSKMQRQRPEHLSAGNRSLHRARSTPLQIFLKKLPILNLYRPTESATIRQNNFIRQPFWRNNGTPQSAKIRLNQVQTQRFWRIMSHPPRHNRLKGQIAH